MKKVECIKKIAYFNPIFVPTVFSFLFKINVLFVSPIQYSIYDAYMVSYITSRQRGSSIGFGKEPVCAFTRARPPRVICNNLAAATQGTDGLGVPQCPRFRQVQHKHKVSQGGWEPEITLMWHLSQPKTNYRSCFIRNKCTPVRTALPEIYLGDLSAWKTARRANPKGKKELLDAVRYWLSETVSVQFVWVSGYWVLWL